jgi:hypothetical protein
MRMNNYGIQRIMILIEQSVLLADSVTPVPAFAGINCGGVQGI